MCDDIYVRRRNRLCFVAKNTVLYQVSAQNCVCGHQVRKRKPIQTSWRKVRTLRTCTSTLSLWQLRKTIQPTKMEKRAKRSTKTSTSVRSRPNRYSMKRSKSNHVHCRDLRPVMRAMHDARFTSRSSPVTDLVSFGDRLNQSIHAYIFISQKCDIVPRENQNFVQFERF